VELEAPDPVPGAGEAAEVGPGQDAEAELPDVEIVGCLEVVDQDVTCDSRRWDV
jgi:hypothetical protein